MKNLKANLYLYLLLLAAVLLRFYRIDFQSLWIDEINTILQADPNFSFKETYTFLVANDVQPPLYFYVLKIVFKIFGYSSFVLRAFSATLGVAAIYAIYLLGKELLDKRTGLIAATLLCFNYMHIYYSQEARPYFILILFTCLSFYALLKFLKQNNFKNAILYGVFTGLMFYGHPYALFAFAAQCLMLLFAFIQTPKNFKLNFIKTGLVGLLSLVVLYLPAVPLLLIAGKVSSSWIQLPELNVYTQVFKDFFGNSELLIVFVCVLMMAFFFIMFYKEWDLMTLGTFSIAGNALIFGFLIIWILMVMLIPLVRTYLVVPMIVNRYLLGILPAFLLMLAVAISQVKSALIRNIILAILIVVSLVDILVIKKYYFKENKVDMRGASEFVIQNKNDSELIVSKLSWHFDYYLKQAKSKNPTKLSGFNAYIGEASKQSDLPISFWYMDGTSYIEKLSIENNDWLNKHYILSKKINLYGSLAYRYQKLDVDSSIIFLTANDFESPIIRETDDISFFWNMKLKSKPKVLQRGTYLIYVGGFGLPKKPIQDIKAHLNLLINSKKIGSIDLDNAGMKTVFSFEFEVKDETPNLVEIEYDNDILLHGKDRDAFVSLIYLKKKS